MDDSASDSEVEFPVSRKRKANVIFDDDDEEDDDESDDDDDEDSEEGDEDDDDDDEESDDESVDNDIELPDDVGADQCSICLMEFTDQLLGIPDSCNHVFCSVCILEWSKNINTCPVDRKVYYTIGIRTTNDGPVIDKIKVEDRTQVQNEYEDLTACEVCGSGDREDRMLLCDECDRGFHMECLTPALDAIPLDEWFCPGCQADHRALAVDCSIDDMPFVDTSEQAETYAAMAQATVRSRPSTSRRGRARTVATRRRRRTRGQSSRQSTRRRSRGRSSSKGKGSTSRGTSTSTKGTKPKKRRVKKRRRNKKRARKAAGGNEKGKRTRSRSDVSASRYLLPHEMEPSSTFSLFGSDFDLEYLPIVEPRPMVAEPKPQRLSSTFNPDVLGSIFTNLNTLYDNDMSVDARGRLCVQEDDKKSKSHTEVECASKEEQQGETTKTGDGGITSHSKRGMSELNRKRIKYFENLSAKSQDGEVKTFNTIFGKGSSTISKPSVDSKNPQSTYSDSIGFDNTQQKHSSIRKKFGSKKKSTSSTNSVDSKSLSSYKIPRKKSSAANSNLGLNDNKSMVTGLSMSKSKPSTNKTSQMASSSPFADSILHLVKSRQLQPKNNRSNDTNTSRKNDSVGPPGRRRSKDASQYRLSETTSSSDITKSSTFGFGGHTQKTTPLNAKNKKPIRGNVCESYTPSSRQTKRFLSSGTNFSPSSSTSHTKMSELKNTKILLPKYAGDKNRGKCNPGSSMSTFATTTLNKLNPISSTSVAPSNEGSSLGKFQTAKNLQLIDILNKKRNYLSELPNDVTLNTSQTSNSDSGVTGQAGLHQYGESSRASEKVNAITKGMMLPPLKSVGGKSRRPVAVVHPSKLEESGHSGNLSDVDAAKKRKEGIERVRRNQKIQDLVKEALRPFYYHKEITKEQYKYIYKRSVIKIQESSFTVESRGVTKFIGNYVKKIKGEKYKSNAGH